MQTFKQFGSGSVLYVFDIDETLFHTTAKIHVVDSSGKVIQKLNNQQFNDHELRSGETYDFSEFRDAAKFNAESSPVMNMLVNLNRVHDKIKLNLTPGSKIILNTARSDFNDKDTFLHTFRKHGVDIDDIHVYRSGNIHGDELPAVKKLVVIRDHLKTGKYAQVHMYDDSATNLSHFMNLRDEFSHIRFFAWRVSHAGEAKLFKNSG